jgi:creatinine amidohydrolase
MSPFADAMSESDRPSTPFLRLRAPRSLWHSAGVRLLAVFALLVLWASAPPAAAQAASMVFLEEMTWVEVREAVRSGKTTVLVPIGGTEQSGPHMALGKHNARARALAARIAATLGDALVAPVVAYVPEGDIQPPSQHMRYPGTITVPNAAFERMLESAARSLLHHGFKHVVFLGDHGGYRASLAAVAKRVPGVHVPDAYYRAATQGFAALLEAEGFTDAQIGEHAGLADTALTMALVPEMVRAPRLGEANAAGSGVRGDPRRATAELGEKGVRLIVEGTVEAIRRATRR